jgi:hypothetical protein
MNNFIYQKIKLIFVIFISFFTVKFITPQIFLANTPKISPLFIAKLIKMPTYIASIPQKLGNIFDYKNKTKTDLNQLAVKNPLPKDLFFNNITTNVSAAEDKKTKKVYLKIQSGTSYTIEEIEINGVKKKILRIYKQ